jgi:hypothetical protein
MGKRRGACTVYLGNLRGGHLEDLGVDGRIILKCTFERFLWGDVHWVNLDQDRDRWRALVNAVMNLGVP